MIRTFRDIINKTFGKCIWGLITIICFWIAWCCSTKYITANTNIYIYLYFIFDVLSMISYCTCMNKAIKKYKRQIVWQLQGLNYVLLIVMLGILLWDIRSGEEIKSYFVTSIMWIAIGLFWAYRMRMLHSSGDTNIKLIEILKKNILIILVLIIALGFAIEPGRLQFRWDGALYEQECYSRINIHSLSSMGAFGHLSQAYGLLYCLIYAFVGKTDISMAILNIACYLGSIIGFWKCIKTIIPNQDNISYLCGTIMYACSPFLLGMVNYYSLDYITLCLFIWVIYFSYTKQWIAHFCVAIVFVFTKEPAIVTYAGICAGILLADIIEGKKKNSIRKIFIGTQYILMVSIALFWIVMYYLLCGWSGGVGEFKFDIIYIREKLKVLYLLNFNWLLCCVIFVGGVISVLFKKHKNEIRYWYLPLFTSLLFFTVFSISFKTINHARYVAMVPVILNLLAVVTGLVVCKANAMNIFNVVIAILMFISCYFTIDPISLSIFENINVGQKNMIAISEKIIGDSMIYNKQMLGEEEAFNEALKFAIKEDAMIFIPTYGNSTYYFDGSMLRAHEKKEYCSVQIWWNEKDGRREIHENSNYIPVTLNEIYGDTEKAISMAVSVGNKVCYIYAPWLGEEQAELIKTRYGEARDYYFCYKGWVLKALLLNE